MEPSVRVFLAGLVLLETAWAIPLLKYLFEWNVDKVIAMIVAWLIVHGVVAIVLAVALEDE